MLYQAIQRQLPLSEIHSQIYSTKLILCGIQCGFSCDSQLSIQIGKLTNQNKTPHKPKELNLVVPSEYQAAYKHLNCSKHLNSTSYNSVGIKYQISVQRLQSNMNINLHSLPEKECPVQKIQKHLLPLEGKGCHYYSASDSAFVTIQPVSTGIFFSRSYQVSALYSQRTSGLFICNCILFQSVSTGFTAHSRPNE